MAAKINWRKHGTKLRHCHPMSPFIVDEALYKLTRSDLRDELAANAGLLLSLYGEQIKNAYHLVNKLLLTLALALVVDAAACKVCGAVSM